MDYEPPIEDGRVYAIVRKHFYDREYGFLTDVNGKDYFFLDDDAKFGTPLGHTCLLALGVEVSFLPEPDRRRPGLWLAKDIRMIKTPDLTEIEESVICIWHRVFGWAKRTCPMGCPVFVPQTEVLSDMPGPLAPGDRSRHKTMLSRHREKDAWAATEIDVFIPDFPPEEQQVQ